MIQNKLNLAHSSHTRLGKNKNVKIPYFSYFTLPRMLVFTTLLSLCSISIMILLSGTSYVIMFM